MRRALIAGNWKMYKNVAEALELARALRNLLGQVRDTEIVLAPAFTALHPVARVLEDSRIRLAGQDGHFAPEGAYTGNVSMPMLHELGCTHVILGHSERRQYHGEDEALLHRKLKAALEARLVPILCVGETLAQRDAGRTLEHVRAQVQGSLTGFGPEALRTLVLAYEPIWAIGTGRTATPGQAQEVHAYLRALLRELAGPELAGSLRILYGGSVKPDNIDELMACEDIDGALVGGASLKAESFARIVKFQKA
jgi:triosephosphate isomerase